MKRIKSIRAKTDPQKPCNIAFREGIEASGEACLKVPAHTSLTTAIRHTCAPIG